MRKVVTTIFVILLACFLLIWVGTIVKCEILTMRHGSEFLMFDEVNLAEKFKILKYNNDFARIYCVSKNRASGNIFTFRKVGGKWNYDKWEHGVWSKSGTADGFIWPYIR